MMKTRYRTERVFESVCVPGLDVSRSIQEPYTKGFLDLLVLVI